MHEDASARLRAGLAEVPDAASPEACALEVEVAWDGLYLLDWEQMRSVGGRGLEHARALGDSALIAAAGAVTAFGELCERDVVSARAHCDEAAAALDATADGELAARPGAAYMLGWTEHFLERYDDALRHLDRGIAVSRSTGQGQFFLPMTLGKVMALCALGRLEEAAELSESAVEGARLAANDQLLAWALWERCWAAALAGDLELALPAGTESVRLAGALEFNVLTRAGHLAYAYALLEAGEPEGALEQLRLGGADADRPGFEPASQCLWYEQLAAAELARGQHGEAAGWAGRAGECAAGLGLAFADAMALRASARVRLAGDDAAGAASGALAAAEAAERGNAPVQAALARELAGRALAAGGDAAAGAAELERALAQLDACGAHRRRDRVARELRRLGHRVPRRGRRAVAAGAGPLAALSEREREVAELVAAATHEPRDRSRPVPLQADGRHPSRARLREARRVLARGRRGRRRARPDELVPEGTERALRGGRRGGASASSISSSPITSGGRKRSVVGPVALITSRCSSSARRTISGRRRRPRRRPSAPTAHGDHARELAQALAQPLAGPRTAARNAGVVDDVERRVGRRRDDRAAGEGRAVVAGLEAVGAAAGAVISAPIGRPPASALRDRHGVRAPRRALVGPQRPGAAHSGLDLVEDQQRAARRRRRARRQQLAGERVDAGLALDRLEQHRRGAVVDGAGERLRRATARKPGTSGANGACLVSCGVAEARRTCGRERRRGRRRCRRRARRLRASLIAASLASAPELREQHLAAERARDEPLGERGHRLRRRTGSRRGPAAPACSRTAATTRGWQWPTLQTAIPASKSRYSSPSASTSRAARPETNSTRARA